VRLTTVVAYTARKLSRPAYHRLGEW